MQKEIVSIDDVIKKEHCNFLASVLKPYYQDFQELKEMGTSEEICLGLIDTLDSVFKVLNREGINFKL